MTRQEDAPSPDSGQREGMWHMGKPRFLVILLVVTLVSALLWGCSVETGSQAPKAGAPSSAPTTAPAAAVPSGKGAKQFYTMGSGGPGGVWFTMVGGLTTYLSGKLDGVVVSPDVTGGSVENVNRLSTGEQDMAFAHSTHLYESRNKQGVWKDRNPVTNILGVGKVYESHFTLVTLKKTGIGNLKDLEGKRVNLGAAGSGTVDSTRNVLEVLGIKAQTSTLAFDESCQALRDGRMDAIAQAGAPSTGIVELAAVDDIVVLPFTDEELNRILAKYPYWAKAMLPAGVYEDVKEPVPTWSLNVYWVANDKAPTDLVYNSLKAVTSEDGKKFLASVHPSWKEFGVGSEGFRSLGIKEHPGAEKFWQEKK